MKRLQLLRVQRGYSLQQLAPVIGLAVGTIHKVERGSGNVRPSTRLVFERFFGEPFDDLVVDENEGCESTAVTDMSEGCE